MLAACGSKAESARDSIAADVPGAELEPQTLDLADLASVRAFAGAVGSDHPTLDLLINNAGVMMTPPQSTKDGFELQLGTNHLGHFALTGLLLDRLRAGNDARVVTVSSLEHKPGRIDFDDLQSERDYGPRDAYRRSKLANVLFALALERRLLAIGMPVKSVLAHPGYSATNLQSSGPTGIAKAVMRVSNALVAPSAEMGALPTLYAATSPDVQGGDFIGPFVTRSNRG